MCGIAGVVNVPGMASSDIETMLDRIRYRGPDEARVQHLGRTVIGHARLVVVDREGGRQPMTNGDETVWVTCNGEIYNYVELREELEAKGYRFTSRSDTEVLVHLWREEGERMLERLIGMYAFFLWDSKMQRGILARDRQGIKPCFIAQYRGGYAFASEMKAILSLPGMPREVNPDGLKDVFFFNYCPPPQTCFKDISHVEPGTYLLFDGDKEPVCKRYWQWPYSMEKHTPSFEAFEALLDDAVRLQMRFDVDGGMYLSGGVDSSVVAWHLKKQWTLPRLEAFGLNFPNHDYSEFRYSQQVAELLDIDLHEARITPDMIPGIAATVAAHAEQPHGDFSFFLFYMLAQKARKQGKTVLFTGDGPDETMGGQHLHHQPDGGTTLEHYLQVICYMDDDQRRAVLNAEFERSTPHPHERFRAIVAPWATLGPVAQIVAYESTSLLPGNNLVKGDRMGAAWSTEARGPLIDHRVSECFARLPDDQKFRHGHSKYYFKEYAASKLPRDLIFKKKTMPTLPIGEWIKGELYDWARATLAGHEGTYMNTRAALAMLEEHRAGRHNHTRPLRTLLMTQLWLEHCVQAQPALEAA